MRSAVKVLSEPVLYDREFGRQGVRVADVQAWCTQHGHVLPKTLPDVAEFDVVALESLLVAMERGVRVQFRASEIEAAMHASHGVVTRGVRRLVDDIIDAAQAVPNVEPRRREDIKDGDFKMALWELGAECARQWRQLLVKATLSGDLAVVDTHTGLAHRAVPTAVANDLTTPAGRIAALRRIGGKVSGRKGSWNFTKVKDLAALIKSNGLERHDPKTVRSDIRRAADDEAVERAFAKSMQS